MFRYLFLYPSLPPSHSLHPMSIYANLLPDEVVAEKAADLAKGHSSIAPGISPVGHVVNTQLSLHVTGVQLPE